MSSNSQRTVTCYVDKKDYKLFYSISNLSNVSRNAVFAGEIFVRGLKDLVDEIKTKDKSKLSPDARLYLMEIQTRKKIQDQETLNAIVARGVDEQMSDDLHQIVTDLDLDEMAAVEFAQESPFAETIAYIGNNTQSGHCHHWLASIFTERQTIPRPLVMAMAEKQGFSERLVNRASRKLNIVKKKETGGIWHWSAPIINTTNNTTQQT